MFEALRALKAKKQTENRSKELARQEFKRQVDNAARGKKVNESAVLPHLEQHDDPESYWGELVENRRNEIQREALRVELSESLNRETITRQKLLAKKREVSNQLREKLGQSSVSNKLESAVARARRSLDNAGSSVTREHFKDWREAVRRIEDLNDEEYVLSNEIKLIDRGISDLSAKLRDLPQKEQKRHFNGPVTVAR